MRSDRRSSRAKKAKKRSGNRRKVLVIVFVILAIVIARYGTDYYLDNQVMDNIRSGEVPEFVEPQLLNEGTAARPTTALSEINGVVVHYVANPGSTAEANRNYFNKPDTKVSSHFVIGLDGEIIQCVPLYEQAVASNTRNVDTISIEVCHPDDTGKFNAASMTSLIKLTNWLTSTCRLEREDVIRHYDVTGKSCPKYYVENPGAWENFLNQIN